jgi:hypothetical protein
VDVWGRILLGSGDSQSRGLEVCKCVEGREEESVLE